MTAFHPPEGFLSLELSSRWTLDPLVLGGLGLSTYLYALGTYRVWQRAGTFHGIRVWQVNCFGASIVTLVFALISPLDALSDELFIAHMMQHELLMIVAAPLLVAGRPLVAILWAFSEVRRDAIAECLMRPLPRRVWELVSGPLCVLVVHAAVIWLWHIPALFELALGNEWIHGVQHLSFFVSAALFWWVVIHGRYGRAGYGVSVLFVFATALHTSILGALLTVGRKAWYAGQSQTAPEFGLTPLEDQTLAGLIMWVPSGFAFVAIAIALFAAWLGEAQRRVKRLENSDFKKHQG